MSFSEISDGEEGMIFINLDHVIRAHYDEPGGQARLEVYLSDGSEMDLSGKQAERLADALKIS
jgi:hypothetical protein